MGVKKVSHQERFTPTLRPRRAEQVPSASCLDATPQRDASAGDSAGDVRLRGRIPIQEMGPLLHAPAHLPRQGGGKVDLLPPLRGKVRMGGRLRPLVVDLVEDRLLLRVYVHRGGEDPLAGNRHALVLFVEGGWAS